MAAAGDLKERRAGNARRELTREPRRRGLIQRARHHQRRIADELQHRRQVQPRQRHARRPETGRIGALEGALALGDDAWMRGDESLWEHALDRDLEGVGHVLLRYLCCEVPQWYSGWFEKKHQRSEEHTSELQSLRQ